jgi:ATP-binding cassette subfamily B multidrug efflux pump
MNSKPSKSRRLLSYALRYKYKIIGSLLVLCLAVGAELGGPYIIKTIIDKHLSVKTGEMMPVYTLLAFYIGLIAVAGVSNFTQAYTQQSTA